MVFRSSFMVIVSFSFPSQCLSDIVFGAVRKAIILRIGVVGDRNVFVFLKRDRIYMRFPIHLIFPK